MKKTTSGFTIVELLIVIVVIAILAAISIVAYTGIQSRARLSAEAAAAAQAERSIMAYALQTNGESISLSGTLIGYQEGAGKSTLLKPLVGDPDVTMYAVYRVDITSGYYRSFAALNPLVYGSQVFQLQTGPVDADSLGYRIDTSAQVSLGWQAAGVRIPGQTAIGWLQADNTTAKWKSGINQVAIQASSSLVTPHAGWNFTDITATDSDGTTQIVLVFNAAHDQTTRAQVIGWLAQKYGVSL